MSSNADKTLPVLANEAAAAAGEAAAWKAYREALLQRARTLNTTYQSAAGVLVVGTAGVATAAMTSEMSRTRALKLSGLGLAGLFLLAAGRLSAQSRDGPATLLLRGLPPAPASISALVDGLARGEMIARTSGGRIVDPDVFGSPFASLLLTNSRLLKSLVRDSRNEAYLDPIYVSLRAERADLPAKKARKQLAPPASAPRSAPRNLKPARLKGRVKSKSDYIRAYDFTREELELRIDRLMVPRNSKHDLPRLKVALKVALWELFANPDLKASAAWDAAAIAVAREIDGKDPEFAGSSAWIGKVVRSRPGWLIHALESPLEQGELLL